MGWWKNTYFWIALILLVIALIGIARGNQTIADPGQEADPALAWKYLLAAAIMIVNGILSHILHLRDQAKKNLEKKKKEPPISRRDKKE